MTTPTTTDAPSGADVTALVEEYLSGWNEVDPVERQVIVERCWAADGALVDPPLDGRGHEGISAMAAALHAHYPDHRFVRTGDVEHHHDAFRFAWALRGPDGTAALTGTDYGLLGDDGRLARVTGFFDAAPAAGSVTA